jgi:hypothetical protein
MPLWVAGLRIVQLCLCVSFVARSTSSRRGTCCYCCGWFALDLRVPVPLRVPRTSFSIPCLFGALLRPAFTLQGFVPNIRMPVNHKLRRRTSGFRQDIQVKTRFCTPLPARAHLSAQHKCKSWYHRLHLCASCALTLPKTTRSTLAASCLLAACANGGRWRNTLRRVHACC